jgi:DNA-binding transcriptional LysR family regulator
MTIKNMNGCLDVAGGTRMLSYEEMQYVSAFAEYGTLTEVAERYHISQPTITRTMKKAEEVFGVPLFDRTKNSIHLNQNGKLAAQEIAILLKQTDEMIGRVQAYDRANHTISIGTAAAVQLPELVRKLSRVFPDKAISTEMKLPDELMRGLAKHSYQLIILPFDPSGHPIEGMKNMDTYARKIDEEHLMFLLPRQHPLAGRETLRFADLNGENLLLFSEIGFWSELVHRKMPDSRFLVQTERYSFKELIANSVLPCFATDLSLDMEEETVRDERIGIPIEDPEASVTYYLVCRSDDRRRYAALFH